MKNAPVIYQQDGKPYHAGSPLIYGQNGQPLASSGGNVQKSKSSVGFSFGEPEKIVDILAGLDNASSNFTFLNTKVWPEQDIDMIYIQNYLIEKDGKKQIMNIWYKSDSNNKMMFNTYHITPQKRAFEGMHWN